MKLLLDENLPKKLKTDLSDHETFTVPELGWEGTKNGDLLSLMIENNFDVLLTFDKNLQHQQNFEKYPVAVFVLTASTNQYKHLQPLISKVRETLSRIRIGVTVIEE